MTPTAPSPQRRTATTDSAGRFALCDLPIGATITLRVLSTQGRSETITAIVAQAADVARIVLRVDETLMPIAALSGRVIALDSIFRPVVDAEVVIESLGVRARTDSLGRFRITGVVPGTYTVTARQLGRNAVSEQLTLPANDEVYWEAPLSATATLSQVTITATELDPALLEFEEHRRLGLGRFLTSDDLRKAEGRTLSSVLRPVPAMIVNGMGPYGWVMSRRYSLPMRAAMDCKMATPPAGSPLYKPSDAEERQGVVCGCYAQVYIDGSLANPGTPTPPFNVNTLILGSVEAIEWYSSAAGIPGRYARLNSSCGVLVIHTRRPGR